MIRLPDIALTDAAAAGLRALQAEVDAAGSYSDQVTEGKRLFELRNRRGNAIFDEVKRALEAMCCGACRCACCEDSAADEVEHVRPKDLYPNVVFAWGNYIYACGPCNGPKGNHFAVFVADTVVPIEVARKPKAPIVPPLDGAPALIDPRSEDATQLMLLDLRETYFFIPLAAKGTRDHARADYTIRTLCLNIRPLLPRARRQAYLAYVAHVRHYQRERDNKAATARLAELREAVQQYQHPTVWREMQRQREKLPELQAMFRGRPRSGGLVKRGAGMVKGSGVPVGNHALSRRASLLRLMPSWRAAADWLPSQRSRIARA